MKKTKRRAAKQATPNRPNLKVEHRAADVSVLDELVSLDLALANRQFERLETAYNCGQSPNAADVSLYTSATTGARANVAEKAKLLGTYGAIAGKQDRDATPTFRVYVSAGELPPETGAESSKELPEKSGGVE
jgi:hypothetical protein